jgi:lysophospholipase L1-like esterase
MQCIPIRFGIVAITAIGLITPSALLEGTSLRSARAAEFATSPQEQALVQPGDRIVFLGSGWVERMHQHPWLEMMLTLQIPGATFRNVGWSGDTVHGDARAVFGARSDGYQRLMRDMDYAAPKVAFLCYGENEAFGGESERSEFVAGYRKLIEDLKRHPCRVAIVIPRARERVGEGFPNPDQYNANLAKLADEIRKLASDHQCALIDLEKFAPDQRFTSDGVAWNDLGYQESAREVMRQLGYTDLALDRLTEKKPDAIESLRQMILKKNEWFFHRYRPQNETYLFLFRKHEQGNNAVEVERMEEFVRQGESAIAAWLSQFATTQTK